MLYHSSHHPQEDLLAQPSLSVHKGGPKSHSFYFCNQPHGTSYPPIARLGPSVLIWQCLLLWFKFCMWYHVNCGVMTSLYSNKYLYICNQNRQITINIKNIHEIPIKSTCHSVRLNPFTAKHSVRLNPFTAKQSFLICFISRSNRSYWQRNDCLDIKISKCLVSNETNMSIFHPLEVLGRGSEPQL